MILAVLAALGLIALLVRTMTMRPSFDPEIVQIAEVPGRSGRVEDDA